MSPARVPKLPMLYRLVDDLWSVREQAAPDPGTDLDELGDADPSTIAPEVAAAATDVVERTGLPARLSALLAEALTSTRMRLRISRRQLRSSPWRCCGASRPSGPGPKNPPLDRWQSRMPMPQKCR